MVSTPSTQYWQAFCREFQKTFDNQQSQTQAKLLLESITRLSGEQIKTLALQIEQLTRKSYNNNAQDMRNAKMNDAFVKALDPLLARIALKKIANHKSIELEAQLPFAQLVDKIHQEDITRTHIDRQKLNTNSTFSSSINNLSLEIENLTVHDVIDNLTAHVVFHTQGTEDDPDYQEITVEIILNLPSTRI